MKGARAAFVAVLTVLVVAAAGIPVGAAQKPGRACREDKPGRRPKKCQEPTVSVDPVRKPAAPPQAVVAIIDTGINPYSQAFRDDSALAYKHPSTYVPGYPSEAEALKLTLDVPYKQAMRADEDVWATVQRGTLYWIPGTKIVGAISFGSGGTNCPAATEIPPVGGFVQGDCADHTVLDDHGHGSMTASRAVGNGHSLAPDARVVMIEGLGARSVEYAAEAGWIDVQSNSWIDLVPPPAPSGTTEAFASAADQMLTLAASGNGTAYLAGAAPHPTYLLSTAPPGVVLVGGHDNGNMTAWSGSPPHVVADAYSGFTAIVDSSDEMEPHPIACCTSAASPYAAGGATQLVLESRRILGDCITGVQGGVVARGDKGLVDSGPLEDGVFTLEELKDLFFHTAQPHPEKGRDDGLMHWAGEPRAPDYTSYGPGANPFCVGCTTMPIPWSAIPEEFDTYQLIGYGGINEFSVELATEVLHGRAEPLDRPSADAQYEADQALRAVVFSANGGSAESRRVVLPHAGCA